MKKRKPTHIKRDKPDEVFEAPGLRLERRGRFTNFRTFRTPDEQRELIKRIAESRPQLVVDIQTANQQLLEFVHKFNSLELLAQLWFINSVGNPDEYKEYSFEGRPNYVEHLAALELKDSEYNLRNLDMPGREEIEGAQQLLEKIFNWTFFYYGSEPFKAGESAPMSRASELRFHTILNELFVRSPTYYSHHAEILTELFGTEALRKWTLSELQLDISEALKCVQGIADLMEDRIMERRRKATEFALEIRGYAETWKRTGRFTGPENARDIVNRIRNMRGKDAKRAVISLAAHWAFFQLHNTLAFTPAELASKAAVSPGAAESFLETFCLQFGTTPSDYQIPQPSNPLRARPIIKFEGRYFCPVPHLLIWAIKPGFESLLKEDESKKDLKPWQRYQKHRGNLLVSRGLGYFSKVLPRGVPYSNLRYKVVEQGTEKVVELDGLFLFDSYAFLIEAKAGQLSPSARRGGHARMLDDLKDLVEAPHRQILRASEYISKNEAPAFHLDDGRILNLEKKVHRSVFGIALTLENLDVFTKELYQLSDVGLLGTDELPWVLSIDDLRIISETISIPTQFIHYLKWRLHLNKKIKVTAQSELDWFGYYLAEGPKLLGVPDEYDFMTLSTYTTQFDDYYLYEQKERTKPAPRPSQFCPPELASVLTSLEELDGYGYTSACEALLNLSFDERKSFAGLLRELSIQRRRPPRREARFAGEQTEVVLRVRTGDPSLTTITEKTTKTLVVLEFEQSDYRKIVAWSCISPPNDTAPKVASIDPRPNGGEG